MRVPRTLAVALAFASAALHAQQIEELRLQYRTADQVLPLLQPLVVPGSALTGRGNQLFLRAPAISASEIKSLIAALDHAPRALVVALSDAPLTAPQRPLDTAGSVTIASSDAAAGTEADPARPRPAGAGNASTVSARASMQTLRVNEGERARVTLPAAAVFTFRRWTTQDNANRIASDQVVSYEALTDFYLQIDVAGDVALIDVTPADPAVSAAAAEQASLNTQVQARLGDWSELSQSQAPANAQVAATLAAPGTTTSHPPVPKPVWVKVEFAARTR